ncbi:MAG: DinB family protein [Bacteroidota bacterium]
MVIGEVVQHIIFYEIIFKDRIRLILDKGAIPKIPSYTQASTASAAKGKSKEQLKNEFLKVRNELFELVSALSEEELGKVGSIDGFKASVQAMIACASGHQKHHFNVIRQRYLKNSISRYKSFHTTEKQWSKRKTL